MNELIGDEVVEFWDFGYCKVLILFFIYLYSRYNEGEAIVVENSFCLEFSIIFV